MAHFALQLLIIFVSVDFARSDISAASCTISVQGVWVGGRCFFTVKTPVNYFKAWTKCQAQNATLAQIHTTKEYAAVLAMLSVSGGNAWVALQHDTTSKSGDCSFPPTITFWSDASGQPNTNLRGDKTWIRSHSYIYSTYIALADENYGLLAGAFLDEPSGNWWFSLCQIAGPNRTYISNPAKCLLETPAETFSATNELQECANVCTARQWCRSFEYDEVGSECRLYSWSLIDSTCIGQGCAAFDASGTECCYHYDVEL